VTDAGSLIGYPNVAVMNNGTLLAGCDQINYRYYVYSDCNNDGSGTWTQQVSSSFSTPAPNGFSGTIRLLADAGSGQQQLLVVYAETSSAPYFRYNYYNGSGWSGEANITTSSPAAQFFGVSSWSNYTLIDYRTQVSDCLDWQLFNATSASWYGENTAENSVSISCVGEISFDSTANCSTLVFSYVAYTTIYYIASVTWYNTSYCSGINTLETSSSRFLAVNTIISSPSAYPSLGMGLGWLSYSSGNIMFDIICWTPTYYLPCPSYSTSIAGSDCTFSVLWMLTNLANPFNPDLNLSMAFYSTNITGTWVYNTPVSLAFVNATSAWANWTATLPSAGTVVDYYWTCNDTVGAWNTAMPTQNVATLTFEKYSITTLGTTTSSGYYTGCDINSVEFDGCLLFWRNLTNGCWNLTVFNLTSKTFSDVYTSQGESWPYGSAPCFECGGFVIGDTYYTGYCWQNAFPPYFTSEVIYTSNLSTFSILGSINLALESVCNYTGGGTYNNTLYFGGYQSIGTGTYASVDAWYNGADENMWNAAVWHSNDCCFLTMYNSTCMIGSECAPNNIIYTNDGINFAQEYNGPTGAYTSEYPFVWAWSVNVTSNTAYVAASGSPGNSTVPVLYGGMATWQGYNGSYTPTSWNPINLYAVSNGLVGGSDNLLNSSGWTGHPAIYVYTSTGGFGYNVWSNISDTGAVLSFVYDPTPMGSVWYALYYDAVSQNVTLISVTNGTIVVPDDYSTIQSAVDAASPGDTVYVRAGTYHENVQVNEPVSLVGESPQDTVIDGGDVQSVIVVSADNVSITGFTMTEDQPGSRGGWDYADIELSGAGCSIFGNVLTDSFAGVYLSGSANDNNIVGNQITNNDYGVYIGSSACDNVFYHNNFVNNTQQVVCGPLTNTWDDGYPSGGNYWSDYAGADSLSGPYQNRTGSDGIGDTPYYIGSNNTDNYPLMGPFWALSNGVSAVSNSTISDFQISAGSCVSFDTSGPAGTTGFCTLTIPCSTAPPPYTVSADGQNLRATTLYADGGVTVIYFIYSHSTHEVTITGAAGGGGRMPYLD
jgi:parallel beta-helix repeat protein